MKTEQEIMVKIIKLDALALKEENKYRHRVIQAQATALAWVLMD